MAPRRKREKKSFAEALGKRPVTVVTVCGVALLGLWYFLFLGPLLRTVRADGPFSAATAAARAVARQQELDGATALVRQVQQLDTDIKKKAAMTIPETPDVPGLLAMIDALVHQAGMEIIALDVMPTKDVVRGAPGIAVQHIALNVHGGDYAAFRRLLVTIEHNLRVFDVIAIAFHPQTASYTLTIRTYALSAAAAQ